MKTLNHSVNTKVMAALVGMLFMFGNVACNQGGGGSSPAPVVNQCAVNNNGVYNPNATYAGQQVYNGQVVNGQTMPGVTNPCVNQAGYGQQGMVQMMTVISSSGYQDFNMSLQIGGSGAQMPQAGVGYSGPVAIQGTLQITSSMYCGAMPGNYQVSTVQQGQMSGTSVGQMVLQATGPSGMIQMQVYSGIQYVTGRMSLNMNLMVNGQSCGQLVTM
jgi:hypothetical protein